MKKFWMLVVMVVSCAAGLRADELPWRDDYAKTLAEAVEKHQPVLLDFSASWCGPCQMMETTTFADPGVREELKGYLLVKIDLDQAHDLAAKYHVEAIPTCIVLNQFGEQADRHTGYIDAAHFAAWIRQCEYAAFAKESQAEGQRAAMKRAAGQLEADARSDRAQGMVFLLDNYCGAENREDGRSKLAAEELSAWFGRHPDRAVPLLNERRLAVRIFAASLFAEKFGTSFQFDPWEVAANRVVAVERLSKQLEAQPR